MRAAGIPLYALESGDPVRDFDIIGFSVGYEMAYTAILNMLDLAGVPLRGEGPAGFDALVIAGGTAMYNAEPVADFIDMALIGEGEDLLPEVVNLCRRAKAEGWDKPRLLRAAAQIQGGLRPLPLRRGLQQRRHHRRHHAPGRRPGQGGQAGGPRHGQGLLPRQDHRPLHGDRPRPGDPGGVPGLHPGCRFCQAGYVYRPVRCRSKDLLVQYGQEAVADSGYQEMTLSSLSTSDYPDLVALCDGLEPLCERDHVNLSLPSLRADNFSMELMQRLQKGRKAGLTFAPEAGTQRLRDAINKNLTEEDLHQSLRTAFSGGWNAVKLYFMLGLPTETDEDVLAIAEMANHVMHTWREYASNKSRGCGSPCPPPGSSPSPSPPSSGSPRSAGRSTSGG